MKLITRDTDYALRALRYLATHKERIVPVAELVARLKIPRPFLRKLLQILNKEGILESSKGQGGGFRLAYSARKISLVDLMKIFQGDLILNECSFKKLLCPNTKRCLLRKKLDRIEKYVIKELRSITLASLIGEANE